MMVMNLRFYAESPRNPLLNISLADTMKSLSLLSGISGSHGGEYEDDCLMGSCAV
jgi:hypothetical protein